MKSLCKVKNTILVSVVAVFAAGSGSHAALSQNDTGPASGISAVTLREISDFKSLPLLNAKTLRMSFADQDYSDGKHFAYLEGVIGDKVIWKKPVRISEDINLAKTDVMASGHKINIISQLPFSAAYAEFTYLFDGNTVKLLATEHGDPSRDVVDEINDLAVKGTRASFDAYAKKDNSIMYPGQYVNSESVSSLLGKAYKVALKDFAAGRIKPAADRLALSFDASTYLIGLNDDLPDDDKPVPTRWISAWTKSSVELPAAQWVPQINDYGYFLQKLGRHKEAVAMFEAVVKADPARTAAYLNLADSQFALNSAKSAKSNYEIYRDKMAKEDKAAQVPARVLERLK